MSTAGAQVALRKIDVRPSIYKSVSVFVILCESVCPLVCLFVRLCWFHGLEPSRSRQEWMGCTCSGWWVMLVTASVRIDIVQIDAKFWFCEVNLCFNLTLLKLFIDVSRGHGQAPSSVKHRPQQCGATGQFANWRSLMLLADLKFRLHM